MSRMLGMLGLCARAGALVTGEKACIQQIRAGKARAAVLDGAASENAVKAVGQACVTHSVPLVRTGAFQMGDAIGKPGRMAAVITDAGFARRIIELNQVESIDIP